MDLELVTMSTREIDVLDVIGKIHEQRLTQVKAGEILGLSDRQVRRLCLEAARTPEQPSAAGRSPRPCSRHRPRAVRRLRQRHRVAADDHHPPGVGRQDLKCVHDMLHGFFSMLRPPLRHRLYFARWPRRLADLQAQLGGRDDGNLFSK